MDGIKFVFFFFFKFRDVDIKFKGIIDINVLNINVQCYMYFIEFSLWKNKIFMIVFQLSCNFYYVFCVFLFQNVIFVVRIYFIKIYFYYRFVIKF